jgi:hypothetical protein
MSSLSEVLPASSASDVSFGVIFDAAPRKSCSCLSLEPAMIRYIQKIR